MCVCALIVTIDNRTFGETNMNERSSRSHTVFTVAVESRSREEDGTVKVAYLVSCYTYMHVYVH